MWKFKRGQRTRLGKKRAVTGNSGIEKLWTKHLGRKKPS